MSEPNRPQVKVTNKRVTDAEASSQPEVVMEDPRPVTGEEFAVELEAARAQVAQYLDDLQRLKADFENYRKRMVKEQTAIVDRASAGTIERLLPILDNFELALIAADRTKDFESMVHGVEMVFGELLEVLKKEGLERIDSMNKPFDPEQHEAVMHAGGDGEGEEVVVDEMRPGYRLGGRVIRPAMVKVARMQRG